MNFFKKHITLLIVVVTTFLLSSLELKAQWKLDVNGTVKNEDTKKRFEGVTITIKRNGTVWKTITSSPSGEFVLELPPDAIYLVEFSKPGFTTKKMEFSTKNIPSEDAKYGFEFRMEMNLFEEVEGLDVSILNQPIAKIAFDPATGYMDYDPSYTKSIQKELEKLKKEQEEKRKQQEAERKAKEKEYKTIIAAADKFFAAKNWVEAKPLYEQAAKLLPSEDYPSSQLKLIATNMANAEAANQKYTTAIKRADAAFKERNWEKATMEYNAASSHKPTEAYPKNKIKEIETIVANEKKVTKEYNDLLVTADAFFLNKEYEKAKVDFQKAAALKDYEQYPKNKIKEIEGILAELNKKEAAEKALNEKYQALIVVADKALAAKSYQEAKTKYNEALGVKPAEQYPKNKLKEIEGALADLAKKEAEEKALNEKYQALIVVADKALGAKSYQEAKGKYNEALVVKPAEQYPKDKIKEIESALADIAKKEAEEKALNEKYQNLITAADKSLLAKTYEDAKGKYNEALSLKSEEKYPKDKLKEIEGILAELNKKEAEEKALNEKYQNLITVADNALAAKSYQEAKTKYNEALGVKPAEQYPKNKLKEIEGALADLAKKEAEEKALNEKYQALIVVADKALGAKSYQEAKTKYNEALVVKPAEQYPKDKLKEIEGALADLAKKEAEEKALNEKYQNLITAADKALLAKTYEDAKGKYNEALSLKSEEKYPKDKLKEIEGILAELAKKKAEEEASKMAEKEREEKYQQLIASGDKALLNKSFDEAKNSYNEALGVKPAEQYPKDKLKEIEGLLAELAKKKAEEEAALKAEKALNEKYQGLIILADKALTAKSYQEAKGKYNEALGLKPAEQYPKDKIKEIETILNELSSKEEQEKALNLKYQGLITAADKALGTKTYQDAKDKYSEASGLKPNEKYPKDKLKEIENILAELAKKERESELEKEAERKKREYYQAVIAQADAEYFADNFDKAEKKYQEALLIYAEEQYPKNQLKAIAEAKSRKQNEQAINDKYNAIIIEADKAFNSETYDLAKVKYNEALKVKPSESYPKNRLDEIEKILIELAKKEEITVKLNAQDQKKKEYDSFIEFADKQFTDKSYDQAKSTYQKALSVIPSEEYPKNKIDEINKILAEIAEKERKEKSETLAMKARREKYEKLIFDGDKNFMLDNYDNARDNYQQALVLFENEQYPKDQLVKIEAAIQRKKEEKEAKNIVVTKKPLQPGERAKIDDKREREIEARFAKMIQEKERSKNDSLNWYKEHYAKQQEILVSSSIDKTNKAQQEIIATVEKIEKEKQEGDKYRMINHEKLEKEKTYYKEFENDLVKESIDKTNKAQQEIIATVEKIEKERQEGDKIYIENNKNLQEDINRFNQSEKERIKNADDRRNVANSDVVDQQKDINKYNEINEPRYEKKVEELNVYKEEIKENHIILVENADNRREKNSKLSEDIKVKIASDNAASEKRQNEKKEDVKQYAIDVRTQEEIRIKGAIQRVADNRKFLEKLADQIALRELQQAKNYKLNAEKVAAQTEAYMKLQQERHEAETKQNAKAKEALLSYQKQLAEKQTENKQNADKIRAKNEEENKIYKSKLNVPTEEQTQGSIKAAKRLEEEKQFYSDYGSKLKSNQIERSTKADAEKNDVYVGEKKSSSNINEFEKKYPQGITEEEKETGNAIVLKRIKVTDDHVDVYEKIFYKWGGIFYTKNGESISQNIWDNESIEK
ncbi:MAG: hypothetical protein K0B10_06040 [Vicingaceae bacterium]|nr:hypothetical protein [Vicingaceae bacterium]